MKDEAEEQQDEGSTVFCVIPGEAFYHLDAPVVRVTGVDIPMPYTKSLEIAALPQPSDVVVATKKVLGTK